jgi:hypothetical protein
MVALVVHEIPAECTAKRTGRPGPSAETVEHAQETFVRSPQKSTHRASRELQMPQSSVWRILRKRLREKGYRLQLLQALNSIFTVLFKHVEPQRKVYVNYISRYLSLLEFKHQDILCYLIR